MCFLFFHPDFDSVLRAFLLEWEAHHGSPVTIARACFGVAGPVFDNRVQMTNLPWLVDGDAISAAFGIPHVRISNDFAAAASGIEMLQAADLVTLQPGEPVVAAPRVVIGAGTGLGVAYMIWAEGGYRAIAGEGGHTGFAPSTPEQLELWRDLYSRQGRVVAEDVVSGRYEDQTCKGRQYQLELCGLTHPRLGHGFEFVAVADVAAAVIARIAVENFAVRPGRGHADPVAMSRHRRKVENDDRVSVVARAG